MEKDHDEDVVYNIRSDDKRSNPGISPYFAGIAFIVTTFITGFTGAWVAVSGDVRQYMENQKEIRLKEIAHESGQLAIKDDTIRILRIEVSELRTRAVLCESKVQQGKK